MKFVNFKIENKKLIGVLANDEDKIIALNDLYADKTFCCMQDVIEQLNEDDIKNIQTKLDDENNNFKSYKLSEVKLLSPIEKPIHDILCVGVNYQAHLEEASERAKNFKKTSNDAVYFGKRAIKIIGTNEDVQACLDIDNALDYEVELAVIIGKTGKNIPVDKVEDYIFGYSIFNDFSSRRLQLKHMQWFKGKSLDTYSAMGPVILHKSALPFPVEVDIKCSVNEELRQNSNTKLFLNDIPKVVSELSQGMTLEAGDIIATGTPSGVGMGYKPGKWLKSGDEVVCEIPPIGKLINKIK